MARYRNPNGPGSQKRAQKAATTTTMRIRGGSRRKVSGQAHKHPFHAPTRI